VSAVVAVADVVRIGCIIGSAFLIGAVAVIVAAHPGPRMTRWQRSRFAAYVFVSLSVAGTEYERLHDSVTWWRLPLNVAFLATALYGTWGIRQGRDRLPDQPPAVP